MVALIWVFLKVYKKSDVLVTENSIEFLIEVGLVLQRGLQKIWRDMKMCRTKLFIYYIYLLITLQLQLIFITYELSNFDQNLWLELNPRPSR